MRAFPRAPLQAWVAAIPLFQSLLSLVGAQVMSWCKEDQCGDCVSSLTKAGGYPECVIYDTETVFGGLGFQKVDVNKILYRAWGSFETPCDGGPGNIMIRSPAAIAKIGCGDLIFNTNKKQTCSGQIDLQESFMVQFCCGEGDCTSAGVPWLAVAGHTERPNAGGVHAMQLAFPNGTIIEPVEVGSPPSQGRQKEVQKRCDGWKEGSFKQDGDTYLATFNTQVVSRIVGPESEGTEIEVTEIKEISRTTTFSLSVGDPFGIISASVGFEFTDTQATEVSHKVKVPPGVRGYVGFTPVYRCVRGSLTACENDEVIIGEACAAHIVDGVPVGDYTFVQQG